MDAANTAERGENRKPFLMCNAAMSSILDWIHINDNSTANDSFSDSDAAIPGGNEGMIMLLMIECCGAGWTLKCHMTEKPYQHSKICTKHTDLITGVKHYSHPYRRTELSTTQRGDMSENWAVVLLYKYT